MDFKIRSAEIALITARVAAMAAALKEIEPLIRNADRRRRIEVALMSAEEIDRIVRGLQRPIRRLQADVETL